METKGLITVNVFMAFYNALSLLGKCDSPGGMESTRVWNAYAKLKNPPTEPTELVEFIMKEANRMPPF